MGTPSLTPYPERLGYDVLLSATAPGRGEAKAVEALLGHRCEAVILLGPEAGPAELDALGQRAVTVSGVGGCSTPASTACTRPRARA